LHAKKQDILYLNPGLVQSPDCVHEERLFKSAPPEVWTSGATSLPIHAEFGLLIWYFLQSSEIDLKQSTKCQIMILIPSSIILVDAPLTFLAGVSGLKTWNLAALAANVKYRYSNIKLKGFGAYGVVWYADLGFDNRKA
jgi:hypothetical protein